MEKNTYQHTAQTRKERKMSEKVPKQTLHMIEMMIECVDA
jgi:hypothetical protein